ncbi:glycosyltransferase family 4 protein [Panacibacter microcysteis]|uniref:glycosyltransferase family 4 protein n=1 Tax=Panacibacter microcysteis TaxID=2793269 RepID=UPI0018CA90C3|nr:glycosyltransferase family 1 protein [Panacibacter microcysteis]
MNKLNLVFFVHPSFFGSQSMPRYAQMLTEGMQGRGHKVTTLLPQPVFSKITLFNSLRKWFGYIDQYLLFPRQVKKFVKGCDDNTLFIFTDHALGMWMPLVKNRLMVVHCHDFLAQRSALGEIPENPVSSSGKKYQALIRKGFSSAKHFITVSENTKRDLYKFPVKPYTVEVIYNALNRRFTPAKDLSSLNDKVGKDLSGGYILHVGGNQWYKNRKGAIEIYTQWRAQSRHNLPLLLIGARPDESLLKVYEASSFKQDIYLLTGIDDTLLNTAYSGATLLLYPSIAEGFGWPIAEAMACGCPVVTTASAPMSEVGGEAAFYIPKKASGAEKETIAWSMECAEAVEQVVGLTLEQRRKAINAGFENVKRFDQQKMLDLTEAFYYKALRAYKNGNTETVAGEGKRSLHAVSL